MTSTQRQNGDTVTSFWFLNIIWHLFSVFLDWNLIDLEITSKLLLYNFLLSGHLFISFFFFFALFALGGSFFRCMIQVLFLLVPLPKSSSVVVIFYACFLGLWKNTALEEVVLFFTLVIAWTNHRNITTKNKLRCQSPRANYTDRATTACRRSDCQLLRIKSVTWSAWRIPMAVFSVF
jgi:hypothetical protein